MGAQGSKCSTQGSIFIELSKPSFYAGEFIQGTINLQSNGYFSNKIFLVIEGEEKVKLRYETGSGDNRRTVKKKQKEEIFKQVVDIFYFAGGQVPAG
jgi:hypothetical protein